MSVIDDSAFMGPGDEVALLEWANAATSAAPRLVVVFDGTRGAEDAFLYQLVSMADVKDLVVTSVGDTLAETLLARMERPARLMDVAHWKTSDKRKLKRRDAKGGRTARFRRFSFGKKDEVSGVVAAGSGRAWEPVRKSSEGRTEAGDMTVKNSPDEENDSPFQPTGAVSAATLMSAAPSFGATMRREDGGTTLASPSARTIVAVGAASRGIGCTHLSCALALELAGKGVEACCAVYNQATFDAMRRALVPDAKRNDEFSFGGVTFYTWGAQRAHADDYDCVVCDCGLVDYPDDDQDSPASLFRRAGHQTMLVSGAPWLLEESSAAIAARDRDALAAVTWFTVSAGPLVAANIAAAIGQASGRDRSEVHPVPYRPDLMCGDGSRYNDYCSLLDVVVKSSRLDNLDPVEFARRGERRRKR